MSQSDQESADESHVRRFPSDFPSARHDWGRFTARGGDEVEALIREMMDSAADALSNGLRQFNLRSVVLLGGYGRGEGGVEIVDGRERPHNNFDFLVIHRGGGVKRGRYGQRIQAAADAALEPLRARFDIGMDVGVIAERKLVRSPCLVMWYDMRFGHKVIFGDPRFVRTLTQFRVGNVMPADIRNLLVNRGTLLLINDLIADANRGKSGDDWSLKHRRTIVKHGVKAIIGYGDALLFFHNLYDWSYLEKQRRMRTCEAVPKAFRDLYEEAMEFRFRPNYDDYVNRDLEAWNEELRTQCSPVHLEIESRRLGTQLAGWSDYPERAFRHVLADEYLRPRATAKKLVTFAKGGYPGGSFGRLRGDSLSPLAKQGFRAGGAREMLSILFPVVAYHLKEPGFRALAKDALGASGDGDEELRRAYLQVWRTQGDTNFAAVLSGLGISLEGNK